MLMLLILLSNSSMCKNVTGKLVNNRIVWRGDSGLLDGIEMNLDLSKGMYDGGDIMKFGFPSLQQCSLLTLDFEDVVKEVGDPELDHQCWERPEAIRGIRPSTQVNTSFPGTEVAAETAAAMASASLVFKKIDSSYSNLLLEHAQQLFSFADAYRATWLYHASKDLSYLKYVTELNGQQFANWGNPSWFSWDDKHAGTHVLLSRLNIFGSKGMSSEENLDLQMYRKTSEAIMWSGMGLKWNCLQHAMASAFLAVLFSDYMVTTQISTLYCHGKSYSPADMRDLAISQACYFNFATS
ncbi:hypothetical protein POTOM_019203 [Populus tomentosa]|uniref:Glycoside hydrolase family 9 domain-containing protein n=1 Tax=Populus tomentosa TaxID=118781 RepID=A0A8X8A0M9_POPTO|nr:hypothetical protein POTOM_019203 [Populus tomentosa]